MQDVDHQSIDVGRLPRLSAIDGWLLAAAGVLGAGLMFLCRKSARAEGATWGCGYLRPNTRMQYTGASFAMFAADRLLPRPLQGKVTKPEIGGLFPAPVEFSSQCPDPLEQHVYDPLIRRWADAFTRLRFLQQGNLRIYLVYILLAVVAVASALCMPASSSRDTFAFSATAKRFCTWRSRWAASIAALSRR